MPSLPPDLPNCPDDDGHGTTMAIASSEGTGHGVAVAGVPLEPGPAFGQPSLDPQSGPPAPRTALDNRLVQLGQMDHAALRSGWAELFGRPPPREISRRLLLYALSHDAQATAYGGLKPSLRRKLLQAGTRPKQPEPEAERRKLRGTPPPGSRLVREWHGQTHSVEILAHGFLYKGQRYHSLSEVARAITGARWSGPRFFGL
jgi:hypothetical protein